MSCILLSCLIWLFLMLNIENVNSWHITKMILTMSVGGDSVCDAHLCDRERKRENNKMYSSMIGELCLFSSYEICIDIYEIQIFK